MEWAEFGEPEPNYGGVHPRREWVAFIRMSMVDSRDSAPLDVVFAHNDPAFGEISKPLSEDGGVEWWIIGKAGKVRGVFGSGPGKGE